MSSVIKEFLADDKNIVSKSNFCIIRKHVVCNDGFVISVQASRFHHCLPKENLMNGEYSHVELGISHDANKSEHYTSYLDEFTNYGYRSGSTMALVPIERVDEVIELHQGLLIPN